MANTVDLQVVGKNADISRADMSENLEKAFKQDASAFESLLDAAYGESGAYAAQSGVEITLALEGKQQLEQLGLICRLVAAGTDNEVDNDGNAVASPLASPVADTLSAVQDVADLDADGAVESVESLVDNKLGDVDEFEIGDLDASETIGGDDTDSSSLAGPGAIAAGAIAAGAAGAVASVRKMESTLEQDADLEFTQELDEVKDAEGGSSVKKVESTIESLELPVDDMDSGDFSSGIAEAKSSSGNKPAIDDSLNVDFGDELDDADGEKVAMLSKKSAVKSRGDVPEGLSSASFDDLEADLIDPAPAEKADKKEPVEMDDGGLSLSDNNDAPLTEKKSKDESVVPDDGGLSLSDDTSTNDATTDTRSLGEESSPAASASPAEAEEFGDLGADLLAGDPVLDTKEADAKEDTNEPEAEVASELPETTADLAAGVDAAKSEAIESTDASVDIEAASNSAEPTAHEDPTAQEDSTAEAEPVNVDTGNNGDSLGSLLSDLNSKVGGAGAAGAVINGSGNNDAANADTDSDAQLSLGDSADNGESEIVLASQAPPEKPATPTSGLVLGGNPGVMPEITPEGDLASVSDHAPTIDQIDGTASINATPEVAAADANSGGNTADAQKSFPVATGVDLYEATAEDNEKPKKAKKAKKTKGPSNKGKIGKAVAVAAGVAVLAGAGTFAFKNAGSLTSIATDRDDIAATKNLPVKDASSEVSRVIETGHISDKGNLEELSTEQLLVNLSVRSNAQSIVELEPYFLESVDRARSGPRFGAAVPAESERMIGRVPHPADKYFDDWSNREADLSLFLALLDTLIKKGELEVAQQLSDRAKDKLFAVMSSQRLARAYSEVGENAKVSQLMSIASRNTFSIKAPEERVLAISDYGLTEQSLGLNEDAMDTFLKSSILARNLQKPERKTVGLGSAARYFQRSGREDEAQQLLAESLEAGMQLPDNTAARDLALRFVALTEARMGLFNQAIDHAGDIADPVAAVSAYHGIALAIESTGDQTNARKILNMAYRTGSKIPDETERSNLLDKVVLASESE